MPDNRYIRIWSHNQYVFIDIQNGPNSFEVRRFIIADNFDFIKGVAYHIKKLISVSGIDSVIDETSFGIGDKVNNNAA